MKECEMKKNTDQIISAISRLSDETADQIFGGADPFAILRESMIEEPFPSFTYNCKKNQRNAFPTPLRDL